MLKHPLHGKILTIASEEAEVIKEALEGFAFGRFETQVEVQTFLVSKKFRGLKTFDLDSVKKLLTRSLYAGYVEYAPWGVSRRDGKHEPIIDKNTFRLIQEKLNGKAKIYSRKDNSVDFPLRGFVLCSKCNKTMTASWTTGRNGKHPYYHCKTSECQEKGKAVKRKSIEDEFEAILRSIKPKEKTLALTKEILLDVWNKRVSEVNALQKKHENSLDDIRSKMRNLLSRLSKTENENLIQAYEKEVENLTNEERDLENQLIVMRSRKPEFGTALDTTFSFLKNPYLYWMKDDIKAKHLVLKLVFAERISYDRENGFGTAKFSLPLRVFKLSELTNSSTVDPSGFEPLTSGVQNQCSTK